jgi:hypothetical protein
MLGQHCHTILPSPAADLDPDLIRPFCLSACLLYHAPLSGPDGTASHNTAQRCAALHNPRHTARQVPTHALYTLGPRSAFCLLPSSIYLLPYLIRSPQSPVPSIQIPPQSNLARPISYIPITRLGPSFRRSRWMMWARRGARCDGTIKPGDSARI